MAQGTPTKNTLLAHGNETNIQKYELDYELIDYVFVNGDSSILNDLNINGFTSSRLYSDDLEVTDLEHGVKVLIYSELRSNEARNVDPSEAARLKTTTP